jgi:thioredoxin-related protein
MNILISSGRTVANGAVGLLVALFIALSPTAGWADSHLLPAINPADEGLYSQPWFLNTFLDLREDMVETAAEGKQLVIIWEQRGCPYCREMHLVNFRIPEIVDYVRANFNILQLNMWGDREVVDVDGEVISEKELARKYRIQFTPTLQFFPKQLAANNTLPGDDIEVWRLLGYWKPFHFLSTFIYVAEEGYIEEPNFQRFIQARGDKLRAEGKDVVIW